MGLPRAGVELVASGLSSFVGDMGKANSAVSGFASQGAGAGSAFDRGFSQVVTGALRRVGAAVVDFGIQGAKAIAGFVTDSIGVAGDFQAGMNKFQAVAGKGVDTAGLSKFRDLFIQLGRELPVSTTEVEQAAIEMVSGGIDPAIVAGGALRSTLQFAAASGLSLADAAATSAKFLAGWTSSAATTEEKVAFLASSTDDLTKAAAASSTTAAELRLGLFNVQGSAQALHAPFQDVVATLAELAPAFESSAQAGTALNVFMTRLVPSTNPAIDKMNELGLMTTSTKKLMQFMSDQGIKPLGTDLDTLGNQFTEWASAQGMTQKQIAKIWKSFDQSAFFDAQGNFAGMANAAQLLKDKLGGLSDERKIDALHTLFGNDAQKVANLLMQDGAKGIDAMKAKMADANGVAATAALMQAGYNTALENTKGSAEALKITVGTQLLPTLTDFLNNVIAPSVNAVTAFVDALGKGVKPSEALAGAIAPIVGSINRVLPGFAAFVHLVETGSASTAGWARINRLFTDLFGPTIGGMVTTATRSIAGFVTSIQGALQTLQPVFGTIGVLFRDGEASVGGLARMGARLQQVFGADIGTAMSAAILAVQGVVGEFRTAFGDGGITGAANLLITKLSDISPVFAIVVGTIQAAQPLVQTVVDTFGRLISQSGLTAGSVVSAWQTMQGMVSGAVQAVLGTVQGAFGTIQVYIPAVMQSVANVVGAVLGQLTTFWQAHGTEIMGFVQTTWGTISNIVNLALAVVSSIVIGTLQGVAGFINTHGEAIQTILSGAWQAISGIVTGALAIVQGALQTTLSIMQGDWQGAWQAIQNMSATFVLSLGKVITGFLEMIAGFFGTSLKGIGDLWAHNWDQIVKYISDIDWTGLGVSVIDGITGGLLSKAASLAAAAVGVVKGALGAAEGAAGAHSPATEWIPLGKSMGEGAAVGLTGSVEKVAAAAVGLVGATTKAAESAIAGFASGGTVTGTGGKKKGGAALKPIATPSLGKPIVAPVMDAIDQYIMKVADAIGGAITREQAMISMGLSPQVAPPASAGQIAAGGGGGAYHIDNSRHLTMPVQTNMSPSAIQQSAAIALAVMP